MLKKFIKEILKKFFLILFKIGLKFKLIIVPDHYYVPISNIYDLKKNTSWRKKSELLGIKVDINKQLKNLYRIMPFQSEFKSGEQYIQAIKLNAGPGFGVIEAQALYGFIKYYKPNLTIEIGSGVSTHIMLSADLKNIHCIEPYPSNYLIKNKNINLIKKKLQDVDLKIFEKLKKGDLLFIDSTHTLKIGSDVSVIYLDIIPRLKPGVVVHIHDIGFPYNYLPDIENTFFQWMETQFLHALMINNKKIDILFCLSHLHYEKPKELKKIFPNYIPRSIVSGLSSNLNDHFPSSIYLITR